MTYIVRLYLRSFFRWKHLDSFGYRAHAMEKARNLECFGYRVRLEQINLDKSKDFIYETTDSRRFRKTSSRKTR